MRWLLTLKNCACTGSGRNAREVKKKKKKSYIELILIEDLTGLSAVYVFYRRCYFLLLALCYFQPRW